MKEFLTLLWILIIPLITSLYQFVPSTKKTSVSPSRKKKYARFELFEVLKKMFGVIIFIPFAMIFRSGAPFTETTILTGLLAGEMIAFDLMTVVFYFELEHNMVKRLFTFLFVFVNFWISAIWAIQGQLSLKVLWISVIVYLVLGLKDILSFFYKENTK